MSRKHQLFKKNRYVTFYIRGNTRIIGQVKDSTIHTTDKLPPVEEIFNFPRQVIELEPKTLVSLSSGRHVVFNLNGLDSLTSHFKNLPYYIEDNRLFVDMLLLQIPTKEEKELYKKSIKKCLI